MTDDLLANFRSGTPQTRQSPFGYTGDDPGQLFEDLGRGINPSGFVSNVDNEPENVIIDKNGITITQGALSVQDSVGSATMTAGKVVGRLQSGVEFGIAQTKVTADGLVVNDGTVDRVTLGKISAAPDYGLKVVNAGATVIIDGTSNMFKIVATGTLSKVTADQDIRVTSTVTLTGLGTLPTTPAHASFVANGNLSTSSQWSGFYAQGDLNWVASTLGGVATLARVVPSLINTISTSLNGTSQCVVTLLCSQSLGGAFTFYGRYYVLQEAAL